jgi:archaellum component FlaF (FlaF/FlaG flagellin family)
MKSIGRLLFCGVVLVTTGSCSWPSDAILESKDAQSFKVEELQTTRPTKLRVSGLAFNSSMSVKKITTRVEGSTVVVLVHLGLAESGTSGSFSYDLLVPDSVNEVRFGNSPAPIWKRSTGVVPPSRSVE